LKNLQKIEFKKIEKIPKKMKKYQKLKNPKKIEKIPKKLKKYQKNEKI